MKLRQKTLVATFCTALFVALGLGAFLWSKKVYREGPSSQRGPVNSEMASTNTLSGPALSPIAQAELEGPSIKQAMVNCDEEASKNPDALYFFLTPVLPANFESATLLLSPAGDDYGSFFLLSSQVMLSGLEEGALGVNAGPYEFSVMDTATA